MTSAFTLEPLYPYPQRENLLALARQHAAAVDAGDRSPFETLRELGQEGLLTLGRTGSVLPQAAVAFDLATEDTATAFSLWAHRATIAFFDAVGRQLPEGMETGETTGSTAMAAAFKHASGVGELGVQAKQTEGGLLLNGSISWASNLYPGGVMVLPVAVEDAAPDKPGSYIVTLRVGAEGLDVKYQKGLLALDATESGFIRLTDVFVPEADILSRDVPGFLATITAPFLLIQSSFCLGLAAAALAAAAPHTDVSRGIFTQEFEQVNAEYQRLRAELTDLAQEPTAATRRRLLQLRLDVSHLATAATRLEMAVIGGRGYKTTSETARRYREATFLPVQSPTEGHLRYELSQAV